MAGNGREWPGTCPQKLEKFCALIENFREWVRSWPNLADHFRSRRWRTAGKSLALLPAIFPCEAGLESLNPNSASRWPGILQADGRENPRSSGLARLDAERFARRNSVPASLEPFPGAFSWGRQKSPDFYRDFNGISLAHGSQSGRSWLIICDPAAGRLPDNL